MLEKQLREMREQSLNLFQKRDEIDELEGFQQQEMAKVKHMVRLFWTWLFAKISVRIPTQW